EAAQESDWALLAEAARRWKRFRDEWREYCVSQGSAVVQPILVVQVEDVQGEQVTRTDLAQAVKVLEREMGVFAEGELAHCFGNGGDIEADGYRIRKLEVSKIESDETVRVVFFKTALSTGWDCPRAEIMMSFRTAVDATCIAQLVGRMVRTPLARRVEGSEFLNTVGLYLPYYEKTNLATVISALNDPETASSVEKVDGRELVDLGRNPDLAECFDLLRALPTYVIERIPKQSDVRRLMKLGRRLTNDELSADAWSGAKNMIVQTLADEVERLKRDDKRAVQAYQQIPVRQVVIEYGEWRDTGEGETVYVPATPENIQELFETAGRMLGEGLHEDYWQAKSDQANPEQAKVELFSVLQDQRCWQRLEP
ncbi:MAG: hypothetical protein NTU88_14515, partial [Armatimonadetes bacterium]|nr:hypothetical protein [Armatimonadota bacterium]